MAQMSPVNTPVAPSTATAFQAAIVAAGVAAVATLSATYLTGTTDTNYATLELALAATPVGGTLNIYGTWTRTTPFVVNQACTVRGGCGGSITATTGHAVTVTANSVTLDGLTLIGTGAATEGTARAVSAVGTVGTPVDRLTVRNCAITGWSEYGIYAEQVTNFIFDANLISTIAYAGIMVLSGIGGKITGNKVTTITQPTGLTDSYGIAMSRVSTTSLAVSPRSSDIECSGNTVSGNPLWEGIDTHGGQRLTITGNKVLGCYIGIALVHGNNTGGVASYAPLDIICSGNTINSQVSNGTYSNGIQISGAGVTAGSPVESATGIITGNTIIDHGLDSATPASSDGGILAFFTAGVVLSNNRVVRGATCGIQIYHTNAGLIVSGNTIEDAWSNLAAYTMDVRIRSTYNTPTLSGTSIIRGAKTATIVNAWGLWVDSSTNNTVIDGGGNGWAAAVAPINIPVGVFKSCVNDAVPVVKAVAITTPTSDTVGTKAAIDAIRVALTNYGITA